MTTTDAPDSTLILPSSKEELDAMDPEIREQMKKELTRKLKQAAHLLEQSMQDAYVSVQQAEADSIMEIKQESMSGVKEQDENMESTVSVDSTVKVESTVSVDSTVKVESTQNVQTSSSMTDASTPLPNTDSSSSNEPQLPTAQELTLPDGSGNMYGWSQTNDEISIVFVVPHTFQSKDLSLSLTDSTISCKLSFEKEPRVKGRLFSKILPFDSMWQTEDQDIRLDSSHKLLTLHLEKEQKTEWSLLFSSGIEHALDLDPQALYEMGTRHHAVGEHEAAIKYITLAAEKGCIAAQLKLAAWYELGQEASPDYPLPRDPSAAHYWHKQAASLGNGEACYIVANAYIHGTHGLVKNFKEATEWFKKCAESAYIAKSLPAVFISACFQLGLLYMEGGEGLGDPQPIQAAQYWKKSAALGHPTSIYNLGVFFLNGYGVEQDVVGALSMITLARKADPSLQLPPPIHEFTDEQVEILKELAAKNPKEEKADKKQYLMLMCMMAKKESSEKVDSSGKSNKKRKNEKKKKRTPAPVSVVQSPVAWMGAGLLVSMLAVGVYQYLRSKNS